MQRDGIKPKCKNAKHQNTVYCIHAKMIVLTIELYNCCHLLSPIGTHYWSLLFFQHFIHCLLSFLALKYSGLIDTWLRQMPIWWVISSNNLDIVLTNVGPFMFRFHHNRFFRNHRHFFLSNYIFEWQKEWIICRTLIIRINSDARRMYAKQRYETCVKYV